jgi:tRNA(Ile)-lysidine synthase
MPDFIEKIRRLIGEEDLVSRGDRIVVAVSGGIDSTVLLRILLILKSEISFQLGVAHVNHMLRGAESWRDEAFVRDLADSSSIPFYLLKTDVKAYAKASGKSLQHAGRDIRYGFFQDLSQREGYTKIAVAHNRDDQVETFILRMIKGTGLKGLASMQAKRGIIVRPLLHVSRKEIEEYARSARITYVEDSSNQKETYERNFVRRQVVPVMEKLSPAAGRNILLLIRDLAGISEGFETKALDFLENSLQVGAEGMSVAVEALKALDRETRFRVITRVLSNLEPATMLRRRHNDLVEQIIAGERPNTAVMLPHGIVVARAYDKVFFQRKAKPVTAEAGIGVGMGRNRLESLGMDLELTVEGVPHDFRTDGKTAYLDLGALGDLHVRTFREGDRFVPFGMHESVKLKDFFIAQKVPRFVRRGIPLLISGGDIVWVMGYRIDHRYRLTASTDRVLRCVIHPL